MGHSLPLFLYFRLFNKVDRKQINVQNKSLSMTGFEPRTSGDGSNRSTNWATTTAHHRLLFQFIFSLFKQHYKVYNKYIDWLKIVQLTRKLKFTPTIPDLIERFHIIVFQPPKNCLIFFNLKLADLALRKGAESLMLKYQLVWPQTWPFHLTSPLRFNERVGPIPWNIFTCNYKHLAQIYRIFPHFMWKFKV